MKVRAKKLGYYDHLRRYPASSDNIRAGEVFELSDPKHFSSNWMEKVGDDAPVKSQPPSATKKTVGGRPVRASSAVI